MKRLSSLLRTLRVAKGAADLAAVPGLSIAELYDASLEATLIIDAASGAIVEANPAAAHLLGCPRNDLVGAPWLGAFSAASALALTKLESVAQTAGIAAPVRASLREGSRDIEVALSLVRAQPAKYLLAHLSPTEGFGAAAATPDSGDSSMEVLAKAADGFVVTDLGLRLLYANQTFARLAGHKVPGDVVGKSLTRWIDFTQGDLTALAGQMETREAVSAVRTSLKPTPSKSPARTVELTAVAVPDEPQRCFGFWIRDQGEIGPTDAEIPLPGAVD